MVADGVWEMKEATNGVWKSDGGFNIQFTDHGVFIPHSFFLQPVDVDTELVELHETYLSYLNYQWFTSEAAKYAGCDDELLNGILITLSNADWLYWRWHYAQAWVESFPPEIERVGIAVQRHFVRQHMNNYPKGGFVYVIKSDTGHYKIGRSSDPENRMKTFGLQLPIEIVYEAIYPSQDMYADEKYLHQHFQSKWVNGEWFNLNEEDLKFIDGFLDGDVHE